MLLMLLLLLTRYSLCELRKQVEKFSRQKILAPCNCQQQRAASVLRLLSIQCQQL
jgi:redox-regulated HSP33 family molecular chaperone